MQLDKPSKRPPRPLHSRPPGSSGHPRLPRRPSNTFPATDNSPTANAFQQSSHPFPTFSQPTFTDPFAPRRSSAQQALDAPSDSTFTTRSPAQPAPRPYQDPFEPVQYASQQPMPGNVRHHTPFAQGATPYDSFNSNSAFSHNSDPFDRNASTVRQRTPFNQPPSLFTRTPMSLDRTQTHARSYNRTPSEPHLQASNRVQAAIQNARSAQLNVDSAAVVGINSDGDIHSNTKRDAMRPQIPRKPSSSKSNQLFLKSVPMTLFSRASLQRHFMQVPSLNVDHVSLRGTRRPDSRRTAVISFATDDQAARALRSCATFEGKHLQLSLFRPNIHAEDPAANESNELFFNHVPEALFSEESIKDLFDSISDNRVLRVSLKQRQTYGSMRRTAAISFFSKDAASVALKNLPLYNGNALNVSFRKMHTKMHAPISDAASYDRHETRNKVSVEDPAIPEKYGQAQSDEDMDADLPGGLVHAHNAEADLNGEMPAENTFRVKEDLNQKQQPRSTTGIEDRQARIAQLKAAIMQKERERFRVAALQKERRDKKATTSAQRADVKLETSSKDDGWRKVGEKVDIKTATNFTGTCETMCPAQEFEDRVLQRDISIFETSDGVEPSFSKAVKKYRRSAAISEQPSPEEVRPPAVLLSTMEYLKAVCDSQTAQFVDIHNFLRDRTRSLRQDFTFQGGRDESCIKIHEESVRFHILSEHRLLGTDPSVFSSKQNLEQLDKCLISLREMYDLRRENDLATSPNEPEMQAYYMLTRMSDPKTCVQLCTGFAQDVRVSHPVQFALKVVRAASEGFGSFTKYFTLVRMAPYLVACLMQSRFTAVRVRALSIINATHGNPGSKDNVPVSTITRQLGFESDIEAENFCSTLGLEIESVKSSSRNSVENTIRTPSERFQESKISDWVPSRADILIESKASRFRTSEVITGLRHETTDSDTKAEDTGEGAYVADAPIARATFEAPRRKPELKSPLAPRQDFKDGEDDIRDHENSVRRHMTTKPQTKTDAKRTDGKFSQTPFIFGEPKRGNSILFPRFVAENHLTEKQSPPAPVATTPPMFSFTGNADFVQGDGEGSKRAKHKRRASDETSLRGSPSEVSRDPGESIPFHSPSFKRGNFVPALQDVKKSGVSYTFSPPVLSGDSGAGSERKNGAPVVQVPIASTLTRPSPKKDMVVSSAVASAHGLVENVSPNARSSVEVERGFSHSVALAKIIDNCKANLDAVARIVRVASQNELKFPKAMEDWDSAKQVAQLAVDDIETGFRLMGRAQDCDGEAFDSSLLEDMKKELTSCRKQAVSLTRRVNEIFSRSLSKASARLEQSSSYKKLRFPRGSPFPVHKDARRERSSPHASLPPEEKAGFFDSAELRLISSSMTEVRLPKWQVAFCVFERTESVEEFHGPAYVWMHTRFSPRHWHSSQHPPVFGEADSGFPSISLQEASTPANISPTVDLIIVAFDIPSTGLQLKAEWLQLREFLESNATFRASSGIPPPVLATVYTYGSKNIHIFSEEKEDDVQQPFRAFATSLKEDGLILASQYVELSEDIARDAAELTELSLIMSASVRATALGFSEMNSASQKANLRELLVCVANSLLIPAIETSPANCQANVSQNVLRSINGAWEAQAEHLRREEQRWPEEMLQRQHLREAYNNIEEHLRLPDPKPMSSIADYVDDLADLVGVGIPSSSKMRGSLFLLNAISLLMPAFVRKKLEKCSATTIYFPSGVLKEIYSTKQRSCSRFASCLTELDPQHQELSGSLASPREPEVKRYLKRRRGDRRSSEETTRVHRTLRRSSGLFETSKGGCSPIRSMSFRRSSLPASYGRRLLYEFMNGVYVAGQNFDERIEATMDALAAKRRKLEGREIIT